MSALTGQRRRSARAARTMCGDKDYGSIASGYDSRNRQYCDHAKSLLYAPYCYSAWPDQQREREEDQGSGSVTRQKNPQKLHIFRTSQFLLLSTSPRTTHFAEEPSSQWKLTSGCQIGNAPSTMAYNANIFRVSQRIIGFVCVTCRESMSYYHFVRNFLAPMLPDSWAMEEHRIQMIIWLSYPFYSCISIFLIYKKT